MDRKVKRNRAKAPRKKNKIETPNFYFEKKLWKKGFKYVAGVDEVGRGCFAGPVVTGCVVFNPNIVNTKIFSDVIIDDSKKLSVRQREEGERWIKKNSLTWGIGSSTVAEINKKGLVAATHSAFRRAILDANKRLGKRIDYLLIDAFYIPYVRGIRMPNKSTKKKNRKEKNIKNIIFSGNQLAIINGDEKSKSIGAGSILAKVYRDKLMLSLSKRARYKKYGWGRNKGYGTKEHLSNIRKLGITRLHRKKFVETYLLKNTP